jgi:hypothetical protein
LRQKRRFFSPNFSAKIFFLIIPNIGHR